MMKSHAGGGSDGSQTDSSDSSSSDSSRFAVDNSLLIVSGNILNLTLSNYFYVSLVLTLTALEVILTAIQIALLVVMMTHQIKLELEL